MYDFELDRIVEEVKRVKAGKVALQLPEGLKPHALSLARKIEEEVNCQAYVLSDPCYGACDIALQEAKTLGVDLLIHFGHSQLLSVDLPTLYVESTVKLPVKEAVEKALPLLKGDRVGIATLIQHWRACEEARQVLEDAGKKVLIGPPRGRLKRPGQIIGCDYSTAKDVANEAESFLFLGGGMIHPVGLRLVTGKPVVAADPFKGEAVEVEAYAKKVMAARVSDIAEASKARVFGVVVGLKFGQYRPKLIEKVVDMIRAEGRKVFLIASREVTPSLELNFPEVEAFVITACPLIPLFDYEAYRKPILTPQEAMLSFKSGWSIEDYDPFEGF
ncbi:MAG: diphthamide biosynthesis enzyme Dph2 [Thermoprotei archaeon]|nr:MAG: diphthamide biosynthesis enzyme Dph2 [Thermoprotei archaeon]RLF15338.1 MAG: diphthamide biosynthesis enzyme Dph2 [Thermoprotei archaeon]